MSYRTTNPDLGRQLKTMQEDIRILQRRPGRGGATGATGPQGEQGIQGETGPIGPPGAAGSGGMAANAHRSFWFFDAFNRPDLWTSGGSTPSPDYTDYSLGTPNGARLFADPEWWDFFPYTDALYIASGVEPDDLSPAGPGSWPTPGIKITLPGVYQINGRWECGFGANYAADDFFILNIWADPETFSSDDSTILRSSRVQNTGLANANARGTWSTLLRVEATDVPTIINCDLGTDPDRAQLGGDPFSGNVADRIGLLQFMDITRLQDSGSGGGGSGGGGTVAYEPITASQDGITDVTDIAGLSATFTATAGTRYRVHVHAPFLSSTNPADAAEVIIADAANAQLAAAGPLGVPDAADAYYIVVPGAGSVTYKARARRTGDGILTWGAALDRPSFILVEDIGT